MTARLGYHVNTWTADARASVRRAPPRLLKVLSTDKSMDICMRRWYNRGTNKSPRAAINSRGRDTLNLYRRSSMLSHSTTTQPPVTLTCERCGKKFRVYPSKAIRGQRFCSRLCSYPSGGPTKKPLAERFWAKVHKTETCWLWTGTLAKNGYGGLRSEPTAPGKGVTLFAHRVSYELHFGPIPDGLFVIHKCDNPACVNPKHLKLGTCKDNGVDMAEKGRSGTVQFTETQVQEVRRRLMGGERPTAIAQSMSVSKHNVYCIAANKSWQWLPWPKESNLT